MTDDRLRRATLDDVSQLRDLIVASVSTLSIGYLTPEQIASELEHMITLDTQIILDGTYFVVEGNDGTIRGSGGWSARHALHGGDAYKQTLTEIDPNALLDPTRDAARIRQMFTHPAYARRGIAKRIFEASVEDARSRGYSRVILTATMPGVPLYTSLGFRAIREYHDHFPNGQNIPVVEMEREI